MASSAWTGAAHRTSAGAATAPLAAGDSVGPLVACGLEGFNADARRQWTIADVAELVLGHFDLATADDRDQGVLATAG